MPTPTTTAPHDVRRLFETLPPDHALHLLFKEHERILGGLARFDDLFKKTRGESETPRRHDAALEVRCATLLPRAVLKDPAIWTAMDPSLQEIGPCEWSRDLFA